LKVSNARRSADLLISRQRIRRPAVDVHSIAEHLGMRITELNLGSDCSGLLITQPGLTPCIVVHQQHHEHRKRFTIAHEIGHFALKHHFGDTNVHADSLTSISYRGGRASQGTDPREIAANQFASTLLMPTALMERALLRRKTKLERDYESVVQELAESFTVSGHAMTLRLKSMGYI
jgi:Zn-dependent peptidase ImmA (M78 family)